MKRRGSTNGHRALYTLFHLDSERGFRGGERQLLQLACWLRSRGHENVVVCRRSSPLAGEASRLGLETLHLPFLGEWDPLSALRLRLAARRARHPAIFHAHTAHTAALASLASLASGPARVAHRRVDFRPRGGFSLRRKYSSAGAVVAVSDAIRAVLVRAGVPSDRVKTVRDCIPVGKEESEMAGRLPPLQPANPAERAGIRARLAREWDVPPGSAWIGNIAALVGHKDQDTLLRAMGVLLDGGKNANLFLVGEGPRRQALEALARELGISSRVRFTGYQKDPVPWLQTLDVFVLSSWGEGMGSVLLEALACRLPVVATTAGGIPEVIQNGRTGVLVPPRDPGALADAVSAVLDDPGEALRRAERGLETLSGFGVGRGGRLMEEIYAEVSPQ